MGNNYNSITSHDTHKISIILSSLLVGTLSGGVVVFYRLVLTKAEEISLLMYDFVRENLIWMPALAVVLIGCGLLLSRMTDDHPMIKGSGIPQIKGILMGYIEDSWFKTLICKFVGGTIAILGGLSLGREGPSIQLGASIAEGIGSKTASSRLEKKILIASGASAGLAAAFNAPLAGVVFALEEIFKYFSPLILLATMGAAVVADFISKNIFGLAPVFDFEVTSLLGLKEYYLIIILGCILGIMGALYNATLLHIQKIYGNLKFWNEKNRVVIPFALAMVFGLAFPYVIGGGHHLFELLKFETGIKLVVAALVIKFFFSLICFGSGAPGGIFFPLLVMGAAIGSIFAKLSILYLGLPQELFYNIIILAMAGFFSAIVRAPITGIVLIMEMTGSLSHMLSLTIVSMIAYVVADMLKSPPIYDALLENLVGSMGHTDEEEHSHKIIVEVVVRHGSIYENKAVRDIPWPKKSLLVSVKRGEKEIIPRGDTMLCSGDYLFILTDINSEWRSRETLEELNCV